MPDWTLWYWIRGNGLRVWNMVKVSPGTLIGELTQHIRRDQFDNLPTSLDVYKVPEDHPVFDDDSIKNILGNLSISALGNSLLSPRTVSSYFASLPQDQLHLIIDVSTLVIQIQCWIRGTDSKRFVTVEASRSNDLAQLRKVIKNKGLPPTNIPAYRLKLHKISTREDELAESLTDRGVGQLLDGAQSLEIYFGDIPFSAKPRVVVEWLDESLGTKRGHEGAADDVVERPKRAKIANEAPSKVAQLQYFKKWHCRDSESNFIDHRDFCDDESYHDEPLHYADNVPPISLQYEGFGHFLDIFRGRKDVPGVRNVSSREVQSAVDNFAERMSLVYPDEQTRRHAGLHALDRIFSARNDERSFQLTAASLSSEETSDGLLVGRHRAAYFVAKFKNEPAGNSALPYVEMTGYFAHTTNEATSYSDSASLMRGWNFPCLGLTIVGHYIAFYAIIYYGQWRVVSLTPGLSCIRASGDGDDRMALYAAFTAASVLLARIDDEATKLILNPPARIQEDRALPYISSLHHPYTGIRIDFKILHIFPSKAIDRYLYIAEMTDGRKIVVKFTRHYSLELHTFCEKRGHAPMLLGFEKLPGGFYGVAMEFVDTAFPISQSPHVNKTREWAEQLRNLVRGFHAQDLVHGDLRSPNIVCGENKVMVIDFDWGGKLGEVSYPDGPLNPELTSGRLDDDPRITKADDLRVLDKTLRNVRFGSA